MAAEFCSLKTSPLRFNFTTKRVSQKDQSLDSWVWRLVSNGVFSTKKLSSLIDEKLHSDSRTQDATLKNNLVPSKVEIFIWRVLKRRIPVRTELDKRGIDLDTVRCPLCDDDVETTEHSMIFCRHSMEIWDKVYKWWKLGSFANFSLNEAFHGKNNRPLSFLGSKIWQAMEWTCGDLIWKNRNRKVFSNLCWNGPSGLMEIQLVSFD
ncbi:uncharacterized protein [Rutidosis leptorrhynchoides]|uniref:uncharacterized protein n=1 Tax=Rutidosis leptorrhynchoides TaxID=125765 RepID=UPI003A9971B7